MMPERKHVCLRCGGTQGVLETVPQGGGWGTGTKQVETWYWHLIGKGRVGPFCKMACRDMFRDASLGDQIQYLIPQIGCERYLVTLTQWATPTQEDRPVWFLDWRRTLFGVFCPEAEVYGTAPGKRSRAFDTPIFREVRR